MATTTNTLTPVIFEQESVRILRDEHFSLANPICKVGLIFENCIMVLFYAKNTESEHMKAIWKAVAVQIFGVVFAACNLIDEKKVAQAFSELGDNPNSPYHWAKLQQIPFILVYRKGLPQACFNGDRTVEVLLNYALTLACNSTYKEFNQLGYGMQAENRLETVGYKHYDKSPLMTSTEFKGNNPIRGYDPNIQNVTKGSAEEKKLEEEFEKEAKAEGQAGTTAQPTGTTAQPTGATAQSTGTTGQQTGTTGQSTGTTGQSTGTTTRNQTTSAGSVGNKKEEVKL